MPSIQVATANVLHARAPWRPLADVTGWQEADKAAWWEAAKGKGAVGYRGLGAVGENVLTWPAGIRCLEKATTKTHDGLARVSPDRGWVEALLVLEVGRTYVLSTHLVSGVRGKGKIPRRWRRRRWTRHMTMLRARVAELLARDDVDHVIVLGDFNRGPDACAIPGLKRVASKDNGGIDQIHYSAGLHVHAVRHERAYGSDHEPLVATLSTVPLVPIPEPDPEVNVSTYAKANTQAAWYQDDYPGALMQPNCGVIHTTEGTTLPGYNGGAMAPNYTAVPDFKNKRLNWYAHFPDERSSRALRNLSGGVQTNTANAIQVELVGTCDPAAHRRWSTPHIFWPEPPEWALRDLAQFVADMNKRHGIPIQGPADIWTAYPESYGSGGQRFSFARWRSFYGWCGHQHVPENAHGDPGAFPWAEVAKRAKALIDPKPEPNLPNRVELAAIAIQAAAEHGVRTVPTERVAVHRDLQDILAIVDRMKRRES